jgi:hypothetical protein
LETVSLASLWVLLGGDVHPNLAFPNLHGKHPDVSGKLVKTPATCEVEAGMMPMAGENSVLDRAPLERKAHVGTPAIRRVDLSILSDHHDGVPSDMHNLAAVDIHLRYRCHAHELIVWLCFVSFIHQGDSS